jgi:phosphopantothenoylcysteine decarboxylase/phosphopantothenate--cysteine ligase
VSSPADGGNPAAGGHGAPSPRRPWQDQHVLLGVTGGIAAYKTVSLARELTRRGAIVEVVLTRSATEFVGAVTFEGVVGRAVHTGFVASGDALGHIRLARWANVVCVAPATADFMARIAIGRADDLLAAILLATRAPVLLCPAMNDAMWVHPQTQLNATHLTDRIGYQLVGPATGALAFGEGSGPGRMEEPDVILEHIGRALEPKGALAGRSVLVTAGPTREPVDAVRVLTNRSSGRMGFALASAAWRRGAEVVLIHGPVDVPPPTGARRVVVETAEQMANAVRAALPTADVLLMAAAVADFRPASPQSSKIKKEQRPDVIALESAPDILKTTRAERRNGLITVGFALETDNARANARRKLETKGLDLIVLNEANAPGSGFEVETNRVVLLRADGEEELPLLPKTEVAEQILDRVALLLGGAS